MKQKISRITDILRRDDGISGAMHYTEQISWILFLKFLDDFEIRESDNAFLDWKDYNYIIEPNYRWSNWIKKPSWDDLKDFVNLELFPYLKSFKAWFKILWRKGIWIVFALPLFILSNKTFGNLFFKVFDRLFVILFLSST